MAAAMYAGLLAHGGLQEIALATRQAAHAPSPMKGDLLLDCLAVRFTEGYGSPVHNASDCGISTTRQRSGSSTVTAPFSSRSVGRAMRTFCTGSFAGQGWEVMMTLTFGGRGL